MIIYIAVIAVLFLFAKYKRDKNEEEIYKQEMESLKPKPAPKKYDFYSPGVSGVEGFMGWRGK